MIKEDTSKTLYLFKLDAETGEIKCTSIYNYSIKYVSINSPCKDDYYRFEMDYHIKYAYRRDLDRYKNYQVYSFDPDINHARKIIFDALNEKSMKAYDDYKRFSILLSKIKME